jgi:predicted dehydrogenase
MTRRLKVAVVGAGFSNSPDGRERWAVRGHLPALGALADRYEVIALCTTRKQTAAAAALHFGVPHAFGNVEEMLRQLPDIDVVCVSVRPAVQHSVVMAALRAGKHVYCEQPLGLTTAQAEEMSQLAERKGVRTVVGHQTHYEPAAMQMAELVRQGYVGRPLTFSQSEFFSNYILPRPAHRQWLFQAEMGGHPGYRSGQSLERLTAVLDQDVTDISACMDRKVEERANLDGGAPIRSNQVDNMSYLLRVGAGIEGTLQVSFTAWFGTGTRFELYGTEGMLMIAPGSPVARSKGAAGELKLYGARADVKQIIADRAAPERLEREFEELPGSEAFRFVALADAGRDVFLVAQTWHALAEAIESGRECTPNFHDKAKIHRVWDAAERAVLEKRWVSVDYSGLAVT